MRLLLLLGILIPTMSIAQWPLSDIGTTIEINGVHIKDNGEVLISGAFGTVMKSDDCGSTWTDIVTGYANDLGKMQFLTDDLGYILADDGQYGKTTDGGETWVFSATPAPDDLESMYFLNESIGVIVGKDGGIIRTENGGNTWTLQSSGTTQRLQGVYFIDANSGIVAGRNNTLLKTSDGGMNWIAVSGASGDMGNIYFSNNDNGFICAEGGLYQINSELSSIQFMSLDPLGEFSDIYFVNENVGWVCGEPGAVYVTNTGGSNWIEVPLDGSPFALAGIYGRSLNSAFTVGEFGKVNGICAPTGLVEHIEFNDFASLSPTSTGVRVLFSEEYWNENKIIQLYDLKGSLIQELVSVEKVGQLSIDLPRSAGMVFVNVLIGNQIASTKYVRH